MLRGPKGESGGTKSGTVFEPHAKPEAQLEKFRLPERIASCPLEKLMTMGRLAGRLADRHESTLPP